MVDLITTSSNTTSLPTSFTAPAGSVQKGGNMLTTTLTLLSSLYHIHTVDTSVNHPISRDATRHIWNTKYLPNKGNNSDLSEMNGSCEYPTSSVLTILTLGIEILNGLCTLDIYIYRHINKPLRERLISTLGVMFMTSVSKELRDITLETKVDVPNSMIYEKILSILGYMYLPCLHDTQTPTTPATNITTAATTVTSHRGVYTSEGSDLISYIGDGWVLSTNVIDCLYYIYKLKFPQVISNTSLLHSKGTGIDKCHMRGIEKFNYLWIILHLSLPTLSTHLSLLTINDYGSDTATGRSESENTGTGGNETMAEARFSMPGSRFSEYLSSYVKSKYVALEAFSTHTKLDQSTNTKSTTTTTKNTIHNNTNTNSNILELSISDPGTLSELLGVAEMTVRVPTELWPMAVSLFVSNSTK